MSKGIQASLGGSIRVSRACQGITARLEKEINKAAGEPVAFALLIFTNGRASYVSNSQDRQAIIGEIERLLEHWKAGMPDVPAHKVT